MGLETAWKRCPTILVGDAGGKLAPDPDPAGDRARHSERVLDLTDDQVRSLRKRSIDWGHAVTDAALRRHVEPSLPKGSFPFAVSPPV